MVVDGMGQEPFDEGSAGTGTGVRRDFRPRPGDTDFIHQGQQRGARGHRETQAGDGGNHGVAVVVGHGRGRRRSGTKRSGRRIQPEIGAVVDRSELVRGNDQDRVIGGEEVRSPGRLSVDRRVPAHAEVEAADIRTDQEPAEEFRCGRDARSQRIKSGNGGRSHHRGRVAHLQQEAVVEDAIALRDPQRQAAAASTRSGRELDQATARSRPSRRGQVSCGGGSLGCGARADTSPGEAIRRGQAIQGGPCGVIEWLKDR